LIIDLADVAGVSATDDVTITNEPKFGKLDKISGTLYRYEPAAFPGKDEFSFSIMGSASKRGPVHINVCDDSTALPCNSLHAFEDSVRTAVDTKVTVRFLDNDRLCDVRRKDLKKSIFQRPKYGRASIVGDVILYTPVRGFEGADDLIYLISAKGKGKSYGRVSILVGSHVDSCTVVANGDLFTISSSYAFLPVLRNDNLCGSDSITIIDGPRHGYAFNQLISGEHGIGYVSDSSATFWGDTLRYRICSPISSGCSDTEIVILPKIVSDSSVVARKKFK
jgi:hypothetical protein